LGVCPAGLVVGDVPMDLIIRVIVGVLAKYPPSKIKMTFIPGKKPEEARISAGIRSHVVVYLPPCPIIGFPAHYFPANGTDEFTIIGDVENQGNAIIRAGKERLPSAQPGFLDVKMSSDRFYVPVKNLEYPSFSSAFLS
jgi:hypothetical protein